MGDDFPSYRIHNSRLPLGYIYPVITETLNAYLDEEDISNSSVIQWGRRSVEGGAWWYGVEKVLPAKRELALQQRQQRVIDLYLDIKNNGYNGSVISIFFDDDGNIKVYDGFHRLAIMKYLGMEEMINCQTSKRKAPFPLVERLIELNNGRNLYQPCDDKRLDGFHVWRKDSPLRLAFVLRALTGETVLDIGCAEGYFSREIAKQGYQVTALDSNRKRLSVARHLSIINNLDVEHCMDRWQNYITDKGFHNILYLSVFHHDILSVGVEAAFKQLEQFRGHVKRLFFESPIASKKISWASENDGNQYDFTEDEFKAKIEAATGMTVIDVWRGGRPLFLLESL